MSSPLTEAGAFSESVLDSFFSSGCRHYGIREPPKPAVTRSLLSVFCGHTRKMIEWVNTEGCFPTS